MYWVRRVLPRDSHLRGIIFTSFCPFLLTTRDAQGLCVPGRPLFPSTRPWADRPGLMGLRVGRATRPALLGHLRRFSLSSEAGPGSCQRERSRGRNPSSGLRRGEADFRRRPLPPLPPPAPFSADREAHPPHPSTGPSGGGTSPRLPSSSLPVARPCGRLLFVFDPAEI